MMKKIFARKVNEAPRPKFTPLTVFMLIVLVVYSLSLFALFFYGIMTSFKNGMISDPNYRVEYVFNPYGLPKTFYWNYNWVFSNFVVEATDPVGVGAPANVGFVQMFGNSILYSEGCALTNTVVICITAYGCARFPYKFSALIQTSLFA